MLAAVVAFVLFNLNGREIGSYDSQPAKYLAIQIAKRHSLSLGHVVGTIPALGERPGFALDRRGNYRTAYPLPSALVAGGIAWLLGVIRLVDLDSVLAPALVAKLTASAMTALTVAYAVLAAGRRTSVPGAVLIALALGLGTNLWAAVSQTLWQQETALFALMGAVTLLGAPRRGLVTVLAVGALLGLAGWARPQLAPAIAVLTVSALVRWGRGGALALIPLAAVAMLAIGINLTWFGHPLGAVPQLEALHPSVHGVAGSFGRAPWTAAAGLLLSPSRGLLVFSPIVAFSALGFAAARREGWRSDLLWCLVASAVQFAAYASYAVWWAGHTFGPRYALDILPPLVPLAAAAMPVIVTRPVLRWAAAVCLLWSVGVAATGAFCYPNDAWNSDPTEIDRDHARLWSVADNQIRRCWQRGVSPQNFGLLEYFAPRTGE